ncbi:MAG: hypothetical protein GF384_08085, partial [Elusimicrobia bacterium]|nr:hypothetical protein [Elusimicrobiota bacterium]MBD3412591.1 hypothetical protein [Elusimicrobiota bacterium]
MKKILSVIICFSISIPGYAKGSYRDKQSNDHCLAPLGAREIFPGLLNRKDDAQSKKVNPLLDIEIEPIINASKKIEDNVFHHADQWHSFVFNPQMPDSKILPAHGDSSFWPGSLGITRSSLMDLGVVSVIGRSMPSTDFLGRPIHRKQKKKYNLGNVFEAFIGAPEECLELLEKRLTKPRRTHKEILHNHQVISDLIQSAAGAKESDKIRSLQKMLNLIKEFSKVKKRFYIELGNLRDKHYISNHMVRAGSKEPHKHGYPYPDVTIPLILLGQMIDIISQIDVLLSDNASGIPAAWKKKITDFLQRKKIKTFLKKKNFMDNARTFQNPYLFGPEQYIDPGLPDERKGYGSPYDFAGIENDFESDLDNKENNLRTDETHKPSYDQKLL